MSADCICPRCRATTPGSPCAICGARFVDEERATRLVLPQEAEAPQAGGVTAGGYRIDGALASGGMGLLLRARRASDDGRVVLKAPRRVSAQARQRFAREARALASLEHPNIVRLLDIDCSRGGMPLLVLEYVEGSSLRSLLERAPLPLPLFERVAGELARALDHCHRRGVVHRDLKPENVIVGDTVVTLVDFGLARVDVHQQPGRPVPGAVTPQGSLLGTPPYAAPEQLGDPSRAGCAADAYSLGVLLRECLGGDDDEHGGYRGDDGERRRLWLRICSRLCRLQPQQRLPPAAVLGFAASLPPLTPEPLAPGSGARRARRLVPLLVGAGAAVGAGLALLLLRGEPATTTRLHGYVEAGGSERLVLRVDENEVLQVETVDDTRVRLPGGGPWSRGTLRLHGNPSGRVVLRLADEDGYWQLRLREAR